MDSGWISGAEAAAELRASRGRAGGCKGSPARVSFDGVPLAVVAQALGVPVERLAAVCAGLPPRARPYFLRGAVLVGPEGWTVPRGAVDVLTVCAGWPYVTIEEAADLLGLDASTLHKRIGDLPTVEILPAVPGGRALRRVALGTLLSGKAKRGGQPTASAQSDRRTHSEAGKESRKGRPARARARIGPLSGALPLPSPVQAGPEAGAGGSFSGF